MAKQSFRDQTDEVKSESELQRGRERGGGVAVGGGGVRIMYTPLRFVS